MKVINLGETDSVLNNIVAQMRDKPFRKTASVSVTTLKGWGTSLPTS